MKTVRGPSPAGKRLDAHFTVWCSRIRAALDELVAYARRRVNRPPPLVSARRARRPCGQQFSGSNNRILGHLDRQPASSTDQGACPLAAFLKIYEISIWWLAEQAEPNDREVVPVARAIVACSRGLLSPEAEQLHGVWSVLSQMAEGQRLRSDQTKWYTCQSHL